MPRRSTVGERTLTLNRAESVTLRLADMLDVNYSRVSDLFRAWDTNGDGKISRTEFRRAMEFLKLPSTDAEIDELFDKFDRDGSGSLNFKELQKEIQLARKRASSPNRPAPPSPAKFSVQQQELDDLKASLELAERARRRDVAEKQEELDAQSELVGQQAATIDMLRRQLAAAQSGSENNELKQSDDEEKGLLSKGSPARASVWRRHAAIIALVVGLVLGFSLGRS